MLPGIACENFRHERDTLRQLALTNELILSYRHASIWIVMGRVQKITKHVVTLFFCLRVSASIHHFYHILLSDASVMEDTTNT